MRTLLLIAILMFPAIASADEETRRLVSVLGNTFKGMTVLLIPAAIMVLLVCLAQKPKENRQSAVALFFVKTMELFLLLYFATCLLGPIVFFINSGLNLDNKNSSPALILLFSGAGLICLYRFMRQKFAGPIKIKHEEFPSFGLPEEKKI